MKAVTKNLHSKLTPLCQILLLSSMSTMATADPAVVAFEPNTLVVESQATATSVLTVTDEARRAPRPSVSCTEGGSYRRNNDTFTAPRAEDANITSICTAVVTDNEGYTSEATLTVTVLAVDDDAPTVAFNPDELTINAWETGAATLTIEDNIEVVSQLVSCTNGGIFADGVFTPGEVTQDTVSVCTATASDAAGNTASAELTVNIAVDVTAPILTFSPSSLNLDSAVSAEVFVSVEDENGETPLLTVSCEMGEYANNIYTAPEVSEITETECQATAEDLAGNIGRALLPVTINPVNDDIELDSNRFYDYANQPYPDYIAATDSDGIFGADKDNTGDNPITNEAATLGRVLFYDKNLSTTGEFSCASCHQQQFAFSDPLALSEGVNDVTERSTTRLVNIRFNAESDFFWDERAETLEEQATQPIRSHVEMGFSGCDANADVQSCVEGEADFDQLIERMQGIDYYQELFTLAFGSDLITEDLMQLALAQFQRSIHSFDSKYDMALADYIENVDPRYSVPLLPLDFDEMDQDPAFPLFTDQENLGKALYMTLTEFTEERDPNVNNNFTGDRIGGGVACHSCHIAPEFDIDILETQCGEADCSETRKKNNGVIAVAGHEDETDLFNSRAPSIRDLGHFDGDEYVLNGPMFHDGSATTLEEMLEHYNSGIETSYLDLMGRGENAELDSRLVGIPSLVGVELNLQNWGLGQNLLLTDEEKQALVAFLKTLTGSDMYTNPRWSDPFNEDGTLDKQALHGE